MQGCRTEMAVGGTVQAGSSVPLLRPNPSPAPRPPQSVSGDGRYYPRAGREGNSEFLLDCEGVMIAAGLVRCSYPKTAETTYHATSTYEVPVPMDTSSLPTMLINWLFCQSKHSIYL